MTLTKEQVRSFQKPSILKNNYLAIVMFIYNSYNNVTLGCHCNPAKTTYAFFIEYNASHKFEDDMFTYRMASHIVVSFGVDVKFV